MDGKVCTKCGLWMVYTKFSKERNRKDGYHSWCKPCSAIYNSNYRLKNIEKLREHDRARWPERREASSVRLKIYRSDNQEILKIKDRHKHLSTHWSLRLEVLSYYGGLCACCREDNPHFLQIDHLILCGHQHKKALALTGQNSMYRFLKKEGFPSGYRVLCANCNMSYGMYGYCPHTGELAPQVNLTVRQMVNKRYHQKLRQGVIELYGSVCQCCQETQLQFLTIDHINGDGGAQRKSMTGNYYLSIIRQGYSKNLRVLCANCNCAFGFYGFCPHTGRGLQLALL